MTKTAHPAPATTPALSVPDTILAQLGGGRFIAMTGACSFMGGTSFLQFHLPLCGRAGKRLNVVRVELSDNDTYRVIFYRVKRRGADVLTICERDGVYSDQLRAVMVSETGLDVSL